MTNEQKFQPTEVWTPHSGMEFGEAIESARHKMNAKDPDKLIHGLKQNIERSAEGIVYAVMAGEKPEEYSQTEALVVFNPFANTATANMLVRAEFIREVARHEDIRDGGGKLKPVVMLASPGLHGSKLHLTRAEKKQVRGGDFGPTAKDFLQAVSALHFGKVALLGYSQGADMALSGAQVAEASNIDAERLAIGDPATVEKRSMVNIAKDFFVAAPDLEARAARTGLTSLDSARGIKSDYSRFLASTIYPMNWLAIAKGLGGDSFESKMEQVLESGKINQIVVAYGEKSTMTPSNSIEPSLAKLKAETDETRFMTIRVAGGTHAWGEELTLLAKLYLQALT